jgi:hypothetical protein
MPDSGGIDTSIYAPLMKPTNPMEQDKIRNGMNIADRHGLLGDVHHGQ